ncbi:hypothetical protein [Aestuariimicrobium sp. T2.26MG-19.2B]|uniref:hypothetical protein n=1 Tax=Aestuariimicrobium sp. T2.26MG-19.2B TaxID=3040679 RepID=UPI002477678A|nr:hypothetical protein [Aestuariimicrobium sp. T2.26MG-19.2B]CAI9406855.1 hypothetical protein AESSP_01707 [Aestuariimicrobium sp. T2.26MG-19.2B]
MFATNPNADRLLVSRLVKVLVWFAAILLSSVALAHPSATARELGDQTLGASVADSCVGSGKVWLVVVTDGGSTLRNQCVGNPGSGTAALQNAGLSLTYRSGYLCTIGGYPSACPTTYNGQYWSYWIAKPGGSWSYSNLGADARRPPAGTLDGWCYTAPGDQSSQKSTCLRQLNARVNPASTVPTAPQPSAAPTTATAKPTTARPTTSQPKPTSVKPTQPRPTRPATVGTRTTAPTTAKTWPTISRRPGATTAAPRASTSSKPSRVANSPSAASSSQSAGSTQSPTTSTSPSQEATTVPATVTDSGSPTGLVVTGAVVVAGAAGLGGYLWRIRRP